MSAEGLLTRRRSPELKVGSHRGVVGFRSGRIACCEAGDQSAPGDSNGSQRQAVALDSIPAGGSALPLRVVWFGNQKRPLMGEHGLRHFVGDTALEHVGRKFHC
jgi:hypothetical protein